MSEPTVGEMVEEIAWLDRTICFWRKEARCQREAGNKKAASAWGKDAIILSRIRKRLTESDLAHWMDRCHELEAKLAEVGRRTSDKEGE